MDIQFGYNCKYFVPQREKCEKRAKEMLSRKDLTEKRWLYLNTAIMYSKMLGFDLIKKVENGGIKVKNNKKKEQTEGYNESTKTLMFLIEAAYGDDYCYLSDTGGSCIFFKPHSAQKIRCTIDITSNKKHPNYRRFEKTKDERDNIRKRILELIMTRD